MQIWIKRYLHHRKGPSDPPNTSVILPLNTLKKLISFKYFIKKNLISRDNLSITLANARRTPQKPNLAEKPDFTKSTTSFLLGTPCMV